MIYLIIIVALSILWQEITKPSSNSPIDNSNSISQNNWKEDDEIDYENLYFDDFDNKYDNRLDEDNINDDYYGHH